MVGGSDTSVSFAGMNSRLDEIQAAILRVKLRYLDAENEQRQTPGAASTASSSPATKLGLLRARHDGESVYHQYVVRTTHRDKLRAHLGDHGIGTLIHYPVPVHLQPAYRGAAAPGHPPGQHRTNGERGPEPADVSGTARGSRRDGRAAHPSPHAVSSVAEQPLNHFCTYFDSNYLVRGLALYRSLTRYATPFRLYVLCMDEIAFDSLMRLNLPEVRPIHLADFERGDALLAEAKLSRSVIEYYFTCTPSLLLYLLKRFREIDLITYLDADLYFFGDPAPIYGELGANSILIIGHRFPEHLKHC